MINYILGDVFNLEDTVGGNKIIPHVCNCNNGWGKGFVLALSKQWKEPEKSFKKLFSETPKKEWPNLLGTTQFIKVKDNIFVANMIAQKGYKTIDNPIPLQLKKLKKCMDEVCEFAVATNASIHAPKFGSGLSGAKWDQIDKLIEKYWSVLDVYIYCI